MPLKPDERRAKELAESISAALRDLASAIRSLQHEKERKAEIPASEDPLPQAVRSLRSIADSVNALVEQQPTENQSPTPFERKTLRVQWWLFWATAGAFLAAAIYANIARQQKNVMNSTLFEARRQAVAAEKALREVQIANDLSRQITVATLSPTFAIRPLMSGDHKTLNAEFRNFGKGTATKIAGKSKTTIMVIDSGKPSFNASGPFSRDSVRPDGTFTRTLAYGSFDYSDLLDKIVIVQAVISYDGGFGSTVTQQFCDGWVFTRLSDGRSVGELYDDCDSFRSNPKYRALMGAVQPMSNTP